MLLHALEEPAPGPAEPWLRLKGPWCGGRVSEALKKRRCLQPNEAFEGRWLCLPEVWCDGHGALGGLLD